MSKYGYTGFSGGKLGKFLLPLLQKNPDEIVVVHHIWNYSDHAILQLERRDSKHQNCTFEKIKI